MGKINKKDFDINKNDCINIEDLSEDRTNLVKAECHSNEKCDNILEGQFSFLLQVLKDKTWKNHSIFCVSCNIKSIYESLPSNLPCRVLKGVIKEKSSLCFEIKEICFTGGDFGLMIDGKT